MLYKDYICHIYYILEFLLKCILLVNIKHLEVTFREIWNYPMKTIKLNIINLKKCTNEVI